MKRARPRPAQLAVLALGVACGGDDEPRPMGGGPVLIRAEAVDHPSEPDRVVDLPGAPDVLGVGADTLPVLALGGAVHALGASGLELRRLYAGPGDPTSTGAVRAVAPRAAGGAWLAADAGLFAVGPAYVVAIAPLGPVAAAVEVGSGPLAGLWLAAGAELLRVRGEATVRFDLGVGTVDALALDPSGRRGLVRAGEAVRVLAPSGEALELVEPSFAPRGPRAVAATAGALWLADAAGLFALPHDGAVDAWRQIDAPSGPIVASALAGDASEVHALDASSLLSLGFDGAAARLERRALVGAASALAADGRGGAWVVRSGALEGHRLDAAPRFERDVRPFVEAHCVGCHGVGDGDYRVYDRFSPRAVDALRRIERGDMPRCEGDRVCPPERRLAPAAYAVLARWVEEGRLR